MELGLLVKELINVSLPVSAIRLQCFLVPQTVGRNVSPDPVMLFFGSCLV